MTTFVTNFLSSWVTQVSVPVALVMTIVNDAIEGEITLLTGFCLLNSASLAYIGFR